MATGPIKSYSPEIMVVPFYTREDQAITMDMGTDIASSSSSSSSSSFSSIVQSRAKIVTDYFSRLHSLVIGPGLGRKPIAIEVTKAIIKAATAANLSLVVDADGLYALNQDLTIIQGYTKCILTPNAVEFERLRQKTAEMISVLDTPGKVVSENRKEKKETHP